MIKMLQWLVRIGGLGALALGVSFWFPSARPPLTLHMTLGGIVAISLAILAVWALIDRVRVSAAVAALLWAAAVVYVGTVQDWWVGAGTHLAVEIVHPLLGIGAIGLAEMLAPAITRKRASLGRRA
jgi:uncharacterized membrane protein